MAIDKEKLLDFLKSLDSTYVTKEIIPQIESGAFDIKPSEYSGENKNSKTSVGDQAIRSIAKAAAEAARKEIERLDQGLAEL